MKEWGRTVRLGIATNGPASFARPLPTENVSKPIFLSELSVSQHSAQGFYKIDGNGKSKAILNV